MADSKRLLADALTGLMECKPLDQVRVAEIASAAGVSKQTFYHHFSDKYHLMECCFRDMFAAPFERMGTLAPFDECYIEFLQLCHQRKTFLRNAFTSQDVNSLYRVMHRALRDVLCSVPACVCTAYSTRGKRGFAWTSSRKAAQVARATGSTRAWTSRMPSW